MHSPPCISNWKNPKRYKIPLDKRLAADGRGLHEVQMNEKFAKFFEALYVAEQKASEAVAQKARSVRVGTGGTVGAGGGSYVTSEKNMIDTEAEREERMVREKIREERRRERENQRRFKPDKEFTSAVEKSAPRTGPVEFEKEGAEEADPFGLDQFLTEVKGGKKPLEVEGP